MPSGGLIPGPRLPAVLQTAWWFFGRFSFARVCSRRYGRCFRVRLLRFGEVVVLSDPAMMQQALRDHSGALEGGSANSFGGLIEELAGADSLLLRDGSEHTRLRVALASALDHTGLRVEERACEAARRSIADWPRNRSFALMPHLERISLDVLATTVLGIPEQRRESALAILGEWADSWNKPQILLPFLRGRFGRQRTWHRFVVARQAVRDLIAEELGRDQQSTRCEPSVSARLQGAGSLSEAEIASLLLTLLVAGHHPTVNGLAWALELCIRHLPVLERLRAQLATGSDAYLDAVVAETLRLRPVGQWMARRVVRDFELPVGRVRAGTLLVPNAFLAHHDEGLHSEAERFNPERFGEDGEAREAWIPFGSGARRCPGSDLAMAQLRGVLREVASSLDVRPGHRRPERLVPDGISLVPRRGVLAEVVDRQHM